MMISPLELRWRRAKRLVAGGYVHPQGDDGAFVVSSQAGAKGGPGYRVGVAMENGRLVRASCTCPDFSKQMAGPGVPLLHGVRVCKHILAAASVELLIDEFFTGAR